MIKSNIDVSSVVANLRAFSMNLQNNINIGATRAAANQVKDSVATVPMEAIGKKGIYKKTFRKSEIKLTKRRRTKTGWERFKIRIIPSKTKNDPKQVRYNAMQHSGEEKRYVTGFIYSNNKSTVSRRNRRWKRDGYDLVHRGILKKDDFLTRATNIARTAAIRAYVTYMRERIDRGGSKVSAKEFKSILRG